MGYDSCSKDFDRGSQPPPGNRGSGTGGEVVAVTSTDDAVSPGERAPKRRATLAAVAAEAGVSLPTVSKVVNGRPDVAPDTRARVARLLGEFNYPRPGSRRGQRRGRRSGLIDLIFNGLDSPWAVEILRGVEDWCASHGMAVAVSAVRHGSARPASRTSAAAPPRPAAPAGWPATTPRASSWSRPSCPPGNWPSCGPTASRWSWWTR